MHAEQPLTISVDIRGRERLAGRDLRLQVGIHSVLGGLHVLLSTDVDPTRPFQRENLQEAATVVCTLDELPLKPGAYYLSAWLDEPGGDVLDHVTEQARFVIAPSDFYGTGVLPSEHHVAPTLARQRWTVSTAAPHRNTVTA